MEDSGNHISPTGMEENHDDVLFRHLIVGLQSALYETIEINQWWKSESEKRVIKVPVFYSLTGSEQFLQDYFLNRDKYCKELSCAVDGNIAKTPRGVINTTGSGILVDELRQKYERSVYNREFSSMMGKEIRTMSARTAWIPMVYNFNFKIRASSDIQRHKIHQQMIRKLYKKIKYFIQFEGFAKIPCIVGFPEDYDMSKNDSFDFSQPDENNRPTIECPLEVFTFLPDIDFTTERHTEEKMDKGLHAKPKIKS